MPNSTKIENEKLSQELLKRKIKDNTLFIYDTIDSTNTEVARLLAQNVSDPIIVVSTEQTAGRGTRGKTWISKATGNIYLSLGFRPNQIRSTMQCFTIWMGVTICKLLREKTGLPLQVKWPNDILLEGKKVAGMLTESFGSSTHIKELIFGLGLNVNTSKEDFPIELEQKAGSLYIASGNKQNLSLMAADLIECIIKAYLVFLSGTYKKELQKQWKEYDALYGKTICFEFSNEIHKAVSQGIDENGLLKVKLDNGNLKSLNSNEVTLASHYQKHNSLDNK